MDSIKEGYKKQIDRGGKGELCPGIGKSVPITKKILTKFTYATEKQYTHRIRAW